MAYPTALQCTGLLSMSEIRDWMIAASELPIGTTTVSLGTLISNSHLSDRTAPSEVSQFYCYAIPLISCSTSYTLRYVYENYRDVTVGTTSGNIVIYYSVYNDSGGTYDQYVKIEVQYEGGSWTTVLATTTVPISGSVSGTVNYTYTYNTSAVIKVRITKAYSFS
jgi:hypothetical protein